jgi:hypothetical protein
MSKHTPGPWRYMYGGNIVSPSSELVARVPRPNGEGATATRDANGRLIATVTDLLEACKIADAWFTEQGDNDTHAMVVRAAIAKATGKSQ